MRIQIFFSFNNTNKPLEHKPQPIHKSFHIYSTLLQIPYRMRKKERESIFEMDMTSQKSESKVYFSILRAAQACEEGIDFTFMKTVASSIQKNIFHLDVEIRIGQRLHVLSKLSVNVFSFRLILWMKRFATPFKEEERSIFFYEFHARAIERNGKRSLNPRWYLEGFW